MEYALIVEWAETDTFSTFFFNTLSAAVEDRDKERKSGNIAHIYQKIPEKR